MEKTSILDLAMGALHERVTLAVNEVMENVSDLNTAAEKKRTITVTLEFTPNSDRNDIRVKSTVKTKLEPTNPITATMYVGRDQDGRQVMAEKTTNIPGQLNLSGEEQEKGIVIPLYNTI